MPASQFLTFRAMAYNNAWANHRLLSACAALSQSEFEAKRTGFFPSVKATLNHILIVDWFYVDATASGALVAATTPVAHTFDCVKEFADSVRENTRRRPAGTASPGWCPPTSHACAARRDRNR